MARASVVYGVPIKIEDASYTATKGDRAGEKVEKIKFLLRNEATDLVGSHEIECGKPDEMAAIKAAADAESPVFIVVGVQCVRWDKDGKPADFAKFYVRSFIGVQPSLTGL